MGNEASKTASIWGQEMSSILLGTGLDIGAGKDPVSPGAIVFDKQDGDANKIDELLKNQFDWVFSSHCLEHMLNPWDAILRWWKLVKPGGHLIVLVPDEDLYEQGFWPSIFNTDHKHTFTLKETSWSPVSINVNTLLSSLPDSEVVSIETQTHGFDPALKLSRAMSRPEAIGKIWLAKKFSKITKPLLKLGPEKLLKMMKGPVDQTALGALAQIQFIVRKRPSARDAAEG
jgi:SAM-dependent methyltransferase